jgi:hypothetical protein
MVEGNVTHHTFYSMLSLTFYISLQYYSSSYIVQTLKCFLQRMDDLTFFFVGGPDIIDSCRKKPSLKNLSRRFKVGTSIIHNPFLLYAVSYPLYY